MQDTLYFGDNLDILRQCVADDSVDLVYLDPPFNSQAQYNVLFASPEEGYRSAQAGAFRDTWTWGEEAQAAFDEVMRRGGGVARLLDALHSALSTSDMMAYLAMMAIRLAELHRVLKPTGSLYLHCDPTASHYLKLLLDSIFSPSRFRSEVIWKRSHGHNSAKRYGPAHDALLFYCKGEESVWNGGFHKYDQAYVDRHYRHVAPDGRRYKHENPTGAGVRRGETGKPWRGIDPTPRNRHWVKPPTELEEMDARGLIHWPNKSGAWPYIKVYLDDMRGVPLQDLWTDIPPINMRAKERLGYPTQKPLALLERIIEASSNPGDLVLDPFCGCGTTIEAADRLKRRWLGIDVAVHAIKVIEARMMRAGRSGIAIEGMPRDFASAVRLAEVDKYQFQWWANYLLNPHALREQKRGADRGIDGEIYFPNGPGRPWGRLLTSVKGGATVTPSMVRDFRGVLEREGAEMGLFICLYQPSKAMTTEAAAAGMANTVQKNLPKLQIVALEDWFEGRLPKLPPLEHLPSAATAAEPRRSTGRKKRPDPKAPELPLSFKGGKGDHGEQRYLNPSLIDFPATRAG